MTEDCLYYFMDEQVGKEGEGNVYEADWREWEEKEEETG